MRATPCHATWIRLSFSRPYPPAPPRSQSAASWLRGTGRIRTVHRASPDHLDSRFATLRAMRTAPPHARTAGPSCFMLQERSRQIHSLGARRRQQRRGQRGRVIPTAAHGKMRTRWLGCAQACPLARRGKKPGSPAPPPTRCARDCRRTCWAKGGGLSRIPRRFHRHASAALLTWSSVAPGFKHTTVRVAVRRHSFRRPSRPGTSTSDVRGALTWDHQDRGVPRRLTVLSKQEHPLVGSVCRERAAERLLRESVVERFTRHALMLSQSGSTCIFSSAAHWSAKALEGNSPWC